LHSEQHEIVDGTLTVRTTQGGDSRVVSLCGELDLANASTAESALSSALESNGARVVVDMSELEFIDSTGIALLVAAIGPDGDAAKVRFVPSASPAVTRVLELTGLAERLPLAEA
jgi:anti-anti-sigma factor